jgi:hypothetical protein
MKKQMNEWINQSINQSVGQSVSQSVNQSREIITIKTDNFYIKDLMLHWHNLHNMGKFIEMIMRNQDIPYTPSIFH